MSIDDTESLIYWQRRYFDAFGEYYATEMEHDSTDEAIAKIKKCLDNGKPYEYPDLGDVLT